MNKLIDLAGNELTTENQKELVSPTGEPLSNQATAEPDFSEYQQFVKAVEADLNDKFGNVGYACFIFDKTKGKNYSTLISNAPDIQKVYDVIQPYANVNRQQRRKKERRK